MEMCGRQLAERAASEPQKDRLSELRIAGVVFYWDFRENRSVSRSASLPFCDPLFRPLLFALFDSFVVSLSFAANMRVVFTPKEKGDIEESRVRERRRIEGEDIGRKVSRHQGDFPSSALLPLALEE